MFSVEGHFQVLHFLHDFELGQPLVLGLPAQDGRQTVRVRTVPGEVLTWAETQSKTPSWLTFRPSLSPVSRAQEVSTLLKEVEGEEE